MADEPVGGTNSGTLTARKFTLLAQLPITLLTFLRLDLAPMTAVKPYQGCASRLLQLPVDPCGGR